MKLLPACFVLILTMCSHTATQQGKYTVIEGKAHESKAGLEVGGVMLMNIPEEKYPLYVGKMVRVTGHIEKDHPWKLRPYKKGEPVNQGFDMPVIRDVRSIEIIE